MTTPCRIVIDTDPGVDDAMAIAMALASPELDIKLLTTVFGNADTNITTRNTIGLLQSAGRTDIAVARGADSPIASDYSGPVPHVHGHDGLGDGGFLEGVEVARPSGPMARKAASLALIDAAQTAKNDGVPLTIVTLGPLTNLALALRLDPEFDRQVERVVVMGGNAFCPGNASPAAEANMLSDPEAADIVFGARWPLTMIGLDVTHRVNLTGAAIDRIAKTDGFGGRVAQMAVPLYRDFFEQTNKIDGIFVHDPSVIAWLLQPDLFETSAMPVRVETQGISRGKTWPALGDTDDAAPEPWKGRPKIEVAIGVDGAAVVELLEELLSARL